MRLQHCNLCNPCNTDSNPTALRDALSTFYVCVVFERRLSQFSMVSMMPLFPETSSYIWQQYQSTITSGCYIWIHDLALRDALSTFYVCVVFERQLSEFSMVSMLPLFSETSSYIWQQYQSTVTSGCYIWIHDLATV